LKQTRLASVALIGALLLAGGTAYASDRQADWMTTLNVKLTLLDKLGIDSLHVEVDSDGGAVTLKGTVDKRETKELAETVARSVTGVKRVKNDVRLEASVANPNKAGVAAGEAEAELKDAVLKTKVRIALVDKMGSDGFKIGTDVASSVVTLEFGRGLDTARREEATRVVRTVDGVTKVISVDKK
jgi:osmotically-inducible protein OsmY